MKLSNENRLLILAARKRSFEDNPEEINSLLSCQIKWDELLNTAFSQGIAPLVYKSLKDIPEKAHVPEDVMGKLKMAYHGNVARNMYLYSELELILRAFDEKGIEVMLLKGIALAGTVYGDIGLREMGDIDLLVKEEHLPLAKTIMSELNYEMQRNGRTEEWYRANHFHLPPFVHKEKSIVVEIHWKVAQDSVGINVNNWWERAKGLKWEKTSLLITAPEDMMLHICLSLYHGSYKKMALRGLCDINHTIRFFSEEINWKLFHETVSRSRIARPVYSLLFLVRKFFDNDDHLLSWIEQWPVDLKFAAMVEKIIFTPESEHYALFMRSLTADTTRENKNDFQGHIPHQGNNVGKIPDTAFLVKGLFLLCISPL